MIVVGLHGDWTGCGTYRITNPLTALKRAYRDEVTVHFDVATKADILVCQRTHTPEMIEKLKFIKENRVDGLPKLVLELDDDVWAVEPSSDAYRHYGPEVQERFKIVLGLVDAVIVSTETLREVVLSETPERSTDLPVYVAHNLVPDRVSNPLVTPYGVSDRCSYTRALWAGSWTHKGDFLECLPGIQGWLYAHPNTSLGFIGADYRDLFPRSLQSQLSYWGYTKTVNEYYFKLMEPQADFMIAPLADNRFNQSKSALKILEASALGLPWVASCVGPYSATDLEGGLQTKNTRADWIASLEEMMNPLRRAELSSQGREWVQHNHLLSRAPELYYGIFQEIIGS